MKQEVVRGVTLTVITSLIGLGIFAKPEAIVQAKIEMRDYTDNKVIQLTAYLDKRFDRLENKIDKLEDKR